jgi:hypothetical protein
VSRRNPPLRLWGSGFQNSNHFFNSHKPSSLEQSRSGRAPGPQQRDFSKMIFSLFRRNLRIERIFVIAPNLQPSNQWQTSNELQTSAEGIDKGTLGIAR